VEAYIVDWLSLLVRWLHLIAGIAWIGASFYFVWLDNSLEPSPAGGNARVFGELWSVHGGGFYHNEKFLLGPEKLPATLHWFKWRPTRRGFRGWRCSRSCTGGARERI